MKKKSSILNQAVIILVILLISKGLEQLIPFPMPASVIGLVLMFVLLSSGLLKLEQVDTVGSALTDNIGLLFVPAGISVIKSLDLILAHPVLIIGIIVLSTVFLLVFIGKSADVILAWQPKQAPLKQPAKGIGFAAHLHLIHAKTQQGGKLS